MPRFKPQSTAPVPERAILVGVDAGRGEWSVEESLAELRRLAETDGAEIVEVVTQRLDRPVPKTYIGSGKVVEVRDLVKARALHAKYYRLFHDLFVDVNPVMVKEALALMGRIERVFRLPLCETTDANRARMKDTLAQLGLLP